MGQEATGGAEIKVTVATYGAGGRSLSKTLSQRQITTEAMPNNQNGELHLQQSELGHLHPFSICPPHQLLRANMGNWVFAEWPSLQIQLTFCGLVLSLACCEILPGASVSSSAKSGYVGWP